jgi:hypothetical protein
MPKLNYWYMKWDMEFPICPVDVHFNEWVEAQKLTGKTIFHFGTGAHHVVGIRQAALGNNTFGITASKEEYESYFTTAIDDARVAKSYLCYFGDIYLLNARLLPMFDMVTMFHLGEFMSENTLSPEYGGIDDRGVIDLLTERTRPGGYIFFYLGSDGYGKTAPHIAAWEKTAPVEEIEGYKTLRIYRKRS